MTFEEMDGRLKEALTESRYRHTMGVVETAERLAARYGYDPEKARTAALLHDCAKNLPDEELKRLCRKYAIRLDHVSKREPRLLHAYVGAHLAKDVYGIEDEEIFDAIYYHTTGKKDMTLLGKIVFLADMIEPNRNHLECLPLLRELAFSDLSAALVLSLDSTVRYLVDHGRLLHLDTLKARNFILEERKEQSNGNQ